ncbi:MAG: rod shape-determining protein RodA [Bacteroidota bacterium]|nr:rod shape-determining protein RodA [Candidatus Kapabacteria bacterium]MDW8221196.1 rod shape-determining protein RodA [Bacteroidota bacterium]
MIRTQYRGERIGQAEGAGVIEWASLSMTVLLCLLGLLSIYSATANAGMPAYFNRQLMFAGIGLVLMTAIVFIPVRWIEVVTPFVYTIGLALLVAVLLFGKVVNGQKNWLALGTVTFQPSELSKLCTILAIARFLARPNVNIQTLRDMGTTLLYIVAPVVLIILEPDFGSATVFGAIFLGIALWGGADLMLLYALITPLITALLSLLGTKALVITLLAVALGAVLFRRKLVVTLVVIGINIGAGYIMPWVFNNVLKPYQRQRIEILLNPNRDPRGQGYNVVQAKMAVGSGGLWGRGFQQGTQTQLRYIPKQWTDFIYCVPTEEFGFVGGVLVLALLCGLCIRLIRVAELIQRRFESTVIIGIASVWAYHTFINIGMALGVLPVIGIPLPFMSAGGTALVVNLCMLGLVLNFFRAMRKRYDL